MKFVVLALLYLLFLGVVLFADGQFFNTPHSNTILGRDKLVHFLLFFFLSYFINCALGKMLEKNNAVRTNRFFYLPRKGLLLALVFSFFIAGISEPLQGLVTKYRNADVYDFVFNSLGIFVYAGVAIFLSNKTLEKTSV